jgi:hypothetical protein
MTFTAGQVLTAAELNALDITSLTVDTTTLVVDATNNRVGVGTASPSVPLHVDIGTENTGLLVTSSDTTARIAFADPTTSGNFHVGVGAVGDDLRLYANNATRVIVTGSQVQAPNGAASGPAFSFTGDDDTGVYRYDADALGFATGGTVAARISSNNDLYLAGDYLAFNSATSIDDSIRHNGTDIFFRTNGVDLVEMHRHTNTRASVQVVQEISNTADSGYLAFRFDDDQDTGIYRHGTNIFGVAAGGVPTIAATSTGVAINNSTSTGTGTNCDLVTASVNGVSMLALRRDTSVAAAKSGIVDFDLSDADYLSIQPRSFVWNGQYIGPNGEFGTTNGDDVDDTVPDGSVLMRRAGFIYEEMLGVDLHLVGDHSIDWRALQAATVAKVQSLLERVATLEAA